MLQVIRNLLAGWVAVVFVALLIIPFAFWGINYYFDQGSAIVAATVNGDEISLNEYQTTYQNVRQQWRSINPVLADQEDFIKQQTLDTLISRKLLLQLKDDFNFRVSDEVIRAAISRISAFQGIDGFDSVLYQNYLATSGYNAAYFELQMAEDIALQQLQGGLLETAIMTKPEIIRLTILNKQTRDFAYAILPYEDIKAGIEVSDEEVHAYYDKHTSEFMDPEQVKVAYLGLSLDAIADEVTVDEDIVKSYFENNQANYSISERRKISQILVSPDTDTGEQEAADIAGQIYEQLQSGRAFEDAAGEFTEKESIVIETSDFGFLNKGVLDTEIDEIAFTLEPGQISKPLKTDYGYHILRVEEVSGGTVASFEDVQDQVEADYREQEAQKMFFDLYDRLAALTYEHPDSLDIAAEDLGLTIKESSFLTRESAKDELLNTPEVLSAAFSDEVLLNGLNSELVEVNPRQVIVLREIEHKPSQPRPVADVYEQIMETIRFNKGKDQTSEIGNKVIAALRNGTDRGVLAEQYQLQWQEMPGTGRDNPDIRPGILQKIFMLGRPGNGPLVDGVNLESGDYAVVILNSVHEADPDEITAEAAQPVINQIQQYAGNEAWARIIESLRESAEITINQQNL